jgi:hypothetical protein
LYLERTFVKYLLAPKVGILLEFVKIDNELDDNYEGHKYSNIYSDPFHKQNNKVGISRKE